MYTLKKKEAYWKNENKQKQQHYFNTKFELIKEITKEEMNNECFDCRKKGPQYISINNAIFLCEECAQIHKSFPDNISFIIDNNLNLLTNNFLKYLYYGGNANLDNFINYDYPGLQNYSPEILYRTQAMIYYREELKCKIEQKPKPIRPNNIMAYKIVSENGLINIREGKKFKNNNISNNKIPKKDIINNYYNNYNNTFNTYNNFNLNNLNNKDSNNYINNYENKNYINHYSRKDNKDIKYCSLLNKAFFNEMRNLFGNYSSHNKNNQKTMILKSYSNISKTKNQFNYLPLSNRDEQPLNHSIAYRLNESINYSTTNRTNVYETFSVNRKLNKSAFSDERNKSNKSIGSPRKYIKPKIQVLKSKNIKFGKTEKSIMNKLSKDNGKFRKKKLTIDLSQISRYNETANALKLKDKIYKQKKKICNVFKITKTHKYLKNRNFNSYNSNINTNNNNSNNNNSNNKNDMNNLSYEPNDRNMSQKEMLLNKINSKKKSYLYTEYMKNLQEINNQTYTDSNVNRIDSSQAEIMDTYNHIMDYTNNQNINSYKNKKAIMLKNKNKELSVSYDNVSQRKPIKVKICLTSYKNNKSLVNKKYDNERKKKALQDKKEQEQLEQEASHNLLFEKKDNDLFTNIIYLNNNK